MLPRFVGRLVGLAGLVVLAALQSPHADTSVEMVTNGLWATKNLPARSTASQPLQFRRGRGLSLIHADLISCGMRGLSAI